MTIHVVHFTPCHLPHSLSSASGSKLVSVSPKSGPKLSKARGDLILLSKGLDLSWLPIDQDLPLEDNLSMIARRELSQKSISTSIGFWVQADGALGSGEPNHE